jgi:hypothetical protein
VIFLWLKDAGDHFAAVRAVDESALVLHSGMNAPEY